MTQINTMKKTAIESVDSMAKLYTDIADKIWDNPELSLKEHTAAEVYIAALKEQGFQVTEKLCGIDTAFSGSFGSGKPVIGILAEYDALSGLSQAAGETEEKPLIPGGCGHGCGHNLLGAGSFAAWHWAAAVKWRWPATSESQPKTQSSDFPKSTSASSPALAEHSVYRV